MESQSKGLLASASFEDLPRFASPFNTLCE